MRQRLRLPLGLALATSTGALVVMACSSSTSSTGAAVAEAGPDVTSPTVDADPGDTSTPPVDLLPGCTKDPGATPPSFDPSAASDPIGGAAKFTLAMALAGFPDGPGKLTAAIDTEKSVIRCELREAAAPISVANFVGLARGTRPYKTKAKWQVGRFYDGLIWHRVVPNFVVQGGDPEGVGSGGPGYDLVNENHVDQPLGTLAMAAANDTPSGSQFYVVIGTGPAADYNVFGTCTTEAAIALATVAHDKNGHPDTDIHMLRIQIGRCP